MRIFPRTETRPLAALAVLAAATAPVALVPVLAHAQTVEEVVILPERLGPDGRPVQMSRIVSYADLDLRTRAGQDLLRMRVRDTASDICRELGEPANAGPGPLMRSCEDRAVSGARSQIRAAIDSAWYPRVAYGAPTVGGADVSATVPYDDSHDPTLDQPAYAPSAYQGGSDASATVVTRTVTNGPVADTPQNRARLGGPNSRTGQRTTPAGN